MLRMYLSECMHVCVQELMTAESSSSWVPILNYSWSSPDRFGLIAARFLHPYPPIVILFTHIHLVVSYCVSARAAGMKDSRLQG